LIGYAARRLIQEQLLETYSGFTLSRSRFAMKAAPAITLSDSDRITLERWARGRSTPARLVLRSKIALLAASGLRNKEIAGELRCGTKTVCLWRSRFAQHGIAGIEKDAPRGGRRTQASEALVQQIIHKTLHESPLRRSRWSTRSLAAALGTSPAMVQRVWKAHGLTACQRPPTAAS
jgi:transposase